MSVWTPGRGGFDRWTQNTCPVVHGGCFRPFVATLVRRFGHYSVTAGKLRVMESGVFFLWSCDCTGLGVDSKEAGKETG